MNMNASASGIATIRFREILDSRGRPTVEADVILQDGSLGRAASPSGASTGRYEAHELRDRNPEYYDGYGVQTAIARAQKQVPARLQGVNAVDQQRVDEILLDTDSTPTLEHLGANAILAASLATARAAAVHSRLPLHRYLSSLLKSPSPCLPMPMTNILSGGAHAGRSMDFQDFLAIPVNAKSYSQALEWVARIRSAAAKLIGERGMPTLLADEGGLSPGFTSAEEALDLMTQAIETAHLCPGEDVTLALDVAASELHATDPTRYVLPRAQRTLAPPEMLDYIVGLCRTYPVTSVEDPFDQDDWEQWRRITDTCTGRAIQIVGDDLFATNLVRVSHAVERGIANAVLIKVNQNGTLSGTLEVITRAREAGYATVVSARSGETDDAFIADLAVATGAGQIKIGSVRNAERQSKYNQLLRIEEDPTIPFARQRLASG